MRASEVLQKCLSRSLGRMHALRQATLLHSVQALIVGQRLTSTDVARAWPDATRVDAPLKAMDRLLGNRHLHAAHQDIYAGSTPFPRTLTRRPIEAMRSVHATSSAYITAKIASPATAPIVPSLACATMIVRQIP